MTVIVPWDIPQFLEELESGGLCRTQWPSFFLPFVRGG